MNARPGSRRTAAMFRPHLSVLAACLWITVTALNAAAAGSGDAALTAARQRASEVAAVIVAAAYPDQPSPPADAAWRTSLGVNLQDYANNPGADRARFESAADASRRILKGETSAKHTPADTSRWLDAAADALLAHVRAAETAAAGTAPSSEQAATISELRRTAHLARFHARRLIASVHLNLFKRALRLAELVAATLIEKEAVAAWSELVALAGDHPLASQWRSELKGLQLNLKELEEQCCPPDEAILREKVWEPATDHGQPIP
ncbi:hypothetical protein [Horticoccus sp. 23ND18S-11]|uniref:hypothetical protein n=1 Tax=Horticoccus sp. 23ND18S-11 TaxID=3391832 RepID=UPI0039C982E6